MKKFLPQAPFKYHIFAFAKTKTNVLCLFRNKQRLANTIHFAMIQFEQNVCIQNQFLCIL